LRHASAVFLEKKRRSDPQPALHPQEKCSRVQEAPNGSVTGQGAGEAAAASEKSPLTEGLPSEAEAWVASRLVRVKREVPLELWRGMLPKFWTEGLSRSPEVGVAVPVRATVWVAPSCEDASGGSALAAGGGGEKADAQEAGMAGTRQARRKGCGRRVAIAEAGVFQEDGGERTGGGDCEGGKGLAELEELGDGLADEGAAEIDGTVAGREERGADAAKGDVER
jgi:hypothetical protein